MTRFPSNHYLHEAELWARSIVPILCGSLLRPGEFRRRLDAVIPSTIDIVALIVFPKTTTAALVTSAISPEAVECILLSRIRHHVIRPIDNVVDTIKMTSAMRKAATVAIIVLTGFLIENRYLQTISSLFIAKLIAERFLDKYYASIRKHYASSRINT